MSEHTPTGTRPHQGVPASIKRSVQVIYALVSLSALSLVLTVVLGDTLVENFEAANPTLEAPNFIVPAIVGFVLFGALFLLLALKLAQGARWSRIVLTVLAVLAVLASLVSLPTQPPLFLALNAVTIVLYVALIVFLWRKDSSAHLAAR